MTPERLAQLVQAIKPPPYIEQLFPAQRAPVSSRGRWKALTTSRRAGKTIALIAECADRLEQCKRGEYVLYIAKTRDAAKELAWDKLVALDEQYKLGWTFRVGDLHIETPEGGVLLLRGAEGSDAEKERQKIRGLEVRHAALDEAQSYASTIRLLLRTTIEPSLGKLRGTCTVAGTPGEVMGGGWYNISHKHDGCETKWERYHWTVRENPHFPDAVAYLAGVLVDNQWTEENPTYQREYEGVWIADDSVQVYRYLASRNRVSSIPGYELEWPHGLGVDFGQDDACAWTLHANKPSTKKIFGVLSLKVRGLKPSECAEITGYLVAKTKPDVLVGDGGNLGGIVYIDAINERLVDTTGQEMIGAQKSEKRAYIELLNGDLRAGLLLLCDGPVQWILDDPDAPAVLKEAALHGCAPLMDEMETLPWANEARLKEHAGHANHCCDSNLYDWRHLSAYLSDAAPPRRDPVHGEPGYQEWLMNMDLEAERARIERPWWER